MTTATTTRPEITAETKYLTETLWTDTRVWEIIGRTEKTLTIRSMAETGETVRTENRGGNPWPCVWKLCAPLESGTTKVVRLRKDGTYRLGDSSNPLRHTDEPVSFTDYRF